MYPVWAPSKLYRGKWLISSEGKGYARPSKIDTSNFSPIFWAEHASAFSTTVGCEGSKRSQKEMKYDHLPRIPNSDNYAGAGAGGLLWWSLHALEAATPVHVETLFFFF
jgi:hypothetical protein